MIVWYKAEVPCNLLDVVLSEVLEHEVHVEVLLHRGLVQLHPALSRHALNLQPVESYLAMSFELWMIFAEIKGDLAPSTNNTVFRAQYRYRYQNWGTLINLFAPCAPRARRRAPARWGQSCSGRGPSGCLRTHPPPSYCHNYSFILSQLVVHIVIITQLYCHNYKFISS